MRRLTTKALIALLLTFAAGCVDIVGYMSFFQEFTAHMTGQTVHLAHDLVTARWSYAADAGAVVAAFLLGSIVGRGLIEVGARIGARSIASVTLAIEAGLILAAIMRGDPRASGESMIPSLVMLAGAMGVQTATLTRVGSLTVHTTFVTGMLNKLAQLLSQALFLTFDVRRGRVGAAVRARIVRRAGFIFGIWVFYLSGAAVGTALHHRWGLQSLILPVLVVLLALAVDQVVPLSIEEEHDQSDW
jgi:uncharacterized membrane protein YoaK (UPF0700 family)